MERIGEWSCGYSAACWGQLITQGYINVALHLNSIYIFSIKRQNS